MKRRLCGFLSLAGSGALSALGLTLIASRRWPLMDESVGTLVILFVQWQTLGLTLAKVGVEHLVFAVVSADRGKRFAALPFLAKTAAPIAALFSAVVGAVFSPWAGVVCCAAILCDAYALSVMADLNARGYYQGSALGNLMNYPLFFVALFVLSLTGSLGAGTALAAFLMGSVARALWLWLAALRYRKEGLESFFPAATTEMGVQQGGNFLLFRMDQIILSLTGVAALGGEEVGSYLYLAKFPEILAALLSVAGCVTFPEMYLRHPFTLQELRGVLSRYRLRLAGYLLLLAALFAAYLMMWNGAAPPLYLALPFLLHGVIIIFANNVTYSMLRQGYLKRLVVNLAAVVASGGALSLFLLGGMNLSLLAWLVPLQLVLFMTLSLYVGWGKRMELHVQRNAP